MSRIVLKDKRGNPIEYPGVDKIIVKDYEGNPTEYKEVEIESLSVTENGEYDAGEGKAYSPVVVNVPNPSTGTVNITANGTYDVTEKASAAVNVPNSYAAGDEGKVVSNGELREQYETLQEFNGTVDTTLIKKVIVDVPAWIAIPAMFFPTSQSCYVPLTAVQQLIQRGAYFCVIMMTDYGKSVEPSYAIMSEDGIWNTSDGLWEEVYDEHDELAGFLAETNEEFVGGLISVLPTGFVPEEE